MNEKIMRIDNIPMPWWFIPLVLFVTWIIVLFIVGIWV